MNKVIIFSHESDIDGLGCVVLGKIAFGNIDYVLVPNIQKLELVFRDYLSSKKLDSYDKIFITDLALYNPALKIVAESPIKEKVLVLDHHKSAIEDSVNIYPFTIITEEDSQGKKCATQMLFEHLIQNKLLKPTDSLKIFVELTRLEDTWDWKKDNNLGIKAHDLAILFNAIGVEKYISIVTSKLLDNTQDFNYNQDELNLINTKKKEYEELLKSIMSEAEYFNDENSNKFGIVFANYEYRNELSEYIRNNGNPKHIKYFIIVAMDKGEFGQKSYRAIQDGFDVNEVAMKHGGGGHPAASSVNITEEQKMKALSLDKKDALLYLANSNYVSKE